MSEKEKISVGGQAVIEGVMMRSPHFYAVALRRSNGEIMVDKKPIKSLSQKWPFLKLPLLRGIVVLIESLVIGIKTLTYSADVFAGDTEGEERNEATLKENSTKKDKKNTLSSFILVLTVLFSFSFGIFIFIVLPLMITQYLKMNVFEFESKVAFNLIDGIVRISVFLIYVVVISFLKDIRRVFQYHGAEHKAVYTYEAKEDLAVENARKFSTLHPRCGTAFLVIVMVMSIFLFSLFTPASLLEKFLIRLILIPFVAGISYEIIKFSFKARSNPLIRIFMFPGLFLQKITTSTPDDGQIEVALAALNEVLNAEQEQLEREGL
ncbi:DUF1385 domain-containing protein [bacterium]|nr:DUF1385 domain-containing protein [bacterium]